MLQAFFVQRKMVLNELILQISELQYNESGNHNKKVGSCTHNVNSPRKSAKIVFATSFVIMALVVTKKSNLIEFSEYTIYRRTNMMNKPHPPENLLGGIQPTISGLIKASEYHWRR